MEQPQAVTLAAHGLTLRPLALSDAPALFASLNGDPDVWRWLWTAMPMSDAEMRDVVVAPVLARNNNGEWVSFAVVPDGGDGDAIGMTSYLDIRTRDRHLEIGGTWYGKAAWAGRVNPAAKFLLLQHAFETLGAERVSLKTDINNTRSQGAIGRLGATREGVWRHAVMRPDGSWRDTVYFSVLRDEWPVVKAALAARL